MNTFLSAHKEHIETYHIYMRKSKWCGGGLGPVSDPGLLSCYCHIHHYHHRHPFLLPSHCHPCLFVIIIILGLLVWVRFSTILQNKILQKHIQHKVLNWDALNFSAWLSTRDLHWPKRLTSTSVNMLLASQCQAKWGRSQFVGRGRPGRTSFNFFSN